MESDEICAILRSDGLAIVLVDARFISSYYSGIFSSVRKLYDHHVNSYMGHYLLFYDFDLETNQLCYFDPSFQSKFVTTFALNSIDSPASISIEEFDNARMKKGTDNDILIIQRE